MRKPYDHAIDFVKGADLPPLAKLIRLAPIEKEAIRIWLDEELAKGYIRKSKSPVAAPFFFVKKREKDCCEARTPEICGSWMCIVRIVFTVCDGWIHRSLDR